MTTSQTVRAWKDARYRRSLAGETLAPHPAGPADLAAAQLRGVARGPAISERFFTFIALTVNTCC